VTANLKYALWAACLLIYSQFLGAHERWIVVTTIQAPTEQLSKLAQIPGWHLLVVGDKKTPSDWHLEGAEYLSPERQLELGYEIVPLLPWNHYARKNIGYLYAIEHGANLIYETDDDNVPIGELSPCMQRGEILELDAKGKSFNIFAYYDRPEIWPRGFPLNQILERVPFTVTKKAVSVGIEQGLVNGDPDVDAIFRLTRASQVELGSKPPCALRTGLFCPINSQNTFFHPSAFVSLYLPSTVSMRASDIWRGYIAQKVIWHQGLQVVFSGPNAFQKRNDHSLMRDFALEQDLYLKAGELITFLSGTKSHSLINLYLDLVSLGYFQKEELKLVHAWLNDFKRVKK
jgi:hypothetical protein